LSPDEYGNPERLAVDLAKNKEVESLDIIPGNWEMIMKIRTEDQDKYYNFLRRVISGKKGLQKTVSIISLKQVKTEFVPL
jgi:DNA-binding Lrp family transcriptional regulator